jgi:hypothetical protein
MNAGSATTLGGVFADPDAGGFAVDAFSVDSYPGDAEDNGTGQTYFYNTTVTHLAGASYLRAPSGTVTMSWRVANVFDYVHAIAVFKPHSPRTEMKVAGTSSATAWTTDVTSRTWSHTVSGGDNRLLAVSVSNRDNTTDGDRVISGITYNGTALTQAVSQDDTSAGDNMRAEVWYLVNPPVGTASVVVSFAGGGPTRGQAGAVSFTGAAQTSPVDVTGGTNTGTNPDISNSVTATASAGGDVGRPPLAWWKMDDNTGATTVDSSGNGYTGNFDTGSESPSWTTGRFGSGVHFDGGDNINVGGTQDFLDDAPDLTMSAWVKFDALADYSPIVSRYAAGVGGFNIGLSAAGEGTNNDLEMCINNGADSCGYTSGDIIQTGTWYHVEGVFDGSQSTDATKSKLYVNGVQQTLTFLNTVPTTVGSNNSNILFGAVNGASPFTTGTLDEVKIYDYPRTHAQVQYDYNRGGAVAWYKFDECQGATAYNYAPNANGQPAGMNATITIGATGSNDAIGSCNSGDTTEAWHNGTTGKFNSSIDIDTTDDTVLVSDDSRLDFTDGQDFSLEAWFKRDSDTAIDVIIGKSSNIISSSSGYSLYLTASDFVNFKVDDGGGGGSDNLTVLTSIPITDTNWHHALAVFDDDSATNTTIYVDGTEAKTAIAGTIASINDLSNAVSLAFGAESDGGNSFDGKIDNVKIYNYALTPAQAKRAYNEGAAVRFGPSSGTP